MSGKQRYSYQYTVANKVRILWFLPSRFCLIQATQVSKPQVARPISIAAALFMCVAALQVCAIAAPAGDGRE